jgi:hypothetical protein
VQAGVEFVRYLVVPPPKVQGDAKDMSLKSGQLVDHTFTQSPASAAIQGGPHDSFLQTRPPQVKWDYFAAEYFLPAMKVYPRLGDAVPARIKVRGSFRY